MPRAVINRIPVAPESGARKFARVTTLVECRLAVAPGVLDVLEPSINALEDWRWTLVDERLSGRAWIIGYFKSRREAGAAWRRLAYELGCDLVKNGPELCRLPETRWRESYKSHFKASHYGRLHWVPIWQKEQYRVPRLGVVVWLDPKMVFVTGNHETTRFCAECLVEFAERRKAEGFGSHFGRRKGDSKIRNKKPMPIDAGCGSGILAISAVKLGLQPVVAFDRDPEAIRVSRRNAVLNGVADHVEFITCDLAVGLADRQARLVVANIQADMLRRCARDCVGAVAPGGRLVVSGILASELDQVRTDFTAAASGWRVDPRIRGD